MLRVLGMRKCWPLNFFQNCQVLLPKLFSWEDLWLPESIPTFSHSLILSSPSHAWDITALAHVVLHIEGNYLSRSSVGQCLSTCATKIKRSNGITTCNTNLATPYGLYSNPASLLILTGTQQAHNWHLQIMFSNDLPLSSYIHYYPNEISGGKHKFIVYDPLWLVV